MPYNLRSKGDPSMAGSATHAGPLPLSPKYDPAALDEILNAATQIPLPPAATSIAFDDLLDTSTLTPEPHYDTHEGDNQATPDSGTMPITLATMATDPVAALLALRDSAEARASLRANTQTKDVSNISSP